MGSWVVLPERSSVSKRQRRVARALDLEPRGEQECGDSHGAVLSRKRSAASRKRAARPGTHARLPGSGQLRPGSRGRRPGNGQPRPGNEGCCPGSGGRRPGTHARRPGSEWREPGGRAVRRPVRARCCRATRAAPAHALVGLASSVATPSARGCLDDRESRRVLSHRRGDCFGLPSECRSKIQRLALPVERLAGEAIVTSPNRELRNSLPFIGVRGLLRSISRQCRTVLLK